MGKKPQKSKRFVVLRVYKGRKLSYNENGSVQNENQVIKIEHDTMEWKAVMSTLRLNGYAKVTVEKVFYLDENRTNCTDCSDIKTEVDDNFKPKVDKTLTPEQKRIAELEAKLDLLINGGKEDVENIDLSKENVFTGEVSIEDARLQYEDVIGKKPSHLAKVETLLTKIQEFKNK